MRLIYNSAYLTTTKNTPQLNLTGINMQVKYLAIGFSILVFSCGLFETEDENNNSQIYDYSLEDINISSSTYGEAISPYYFQGQVTLHYFGHQN
jgi:glutathione peroxidase-family protein